MPTVRDDISRLLAIAKHELSQTLSPPTQTLRPEGSALLSRTDQDDDHHARADDEAQPSPHADAPACVEDALPVIDAAADGEATSGLAKRARSPRPFIASVAIAVIVAAAVAAAFAAAALLLKPQSAAPLYSPPSAPRRSPPSARMRAQGARSRNK